MTKCQLPRGAVAALTLCLAACGAESGPTTEKTPSLEPTAHIAQPLIANTDPRWGLLANPEFSGQPERGTYFFAGSARDGTNAYEAQQDAVVGPNVGAYTVFPKDKRDLAWSNNQANQDSAIQEMTSVGVNTVVMSSWGVRFNTQWTESAPMQTSRWSHDELFATAVRSTNARRPVVIMPAIETIGSFVLGDQLAPFIDDSSLSPEPPASGNSLRAQIDDMVRSYICVDKLCTGPGGGLPQRFAKMFDQTGTPRFAILLMAACLNSQDLSFVDFDGSLFARALDNLAAAVERDTGVPVGFTIDAQDVPSAVCGTPGGLVTSSKWIGLSKAQSLLAIQNYRSEMFSSGDKHSDHDRAIRKRDYISQWVNTGIPVILDTSPGYDGDKIFANVGADPSYGNDDTWRNYQSQLMGDGIRGITLNAWNGYTEGWAGMPYCGAAWQDPIYGSCRFPASDAQYVWVQQNFHLDPRLCNSWQFVNGWPTFQVYGAICEKWRATGGSLDGLLGAAASNERDVVSSTTVAGRVSDFASGRIYWWNGVAREIHGDIFNYYMANGAETSGLGFPVSSEMVTPGGNGRMNTMEGGAIMWGNGTHSVYGAIAATYAAWDYDKALGLPTSDEYEWYGCPNGARGRVNTFVHGYISFCFGDSAAVAYYHP